jgi:hypothetical protein
MLDNKAQPIARAVASLAEAVRNKLTEKETNGK